MLNASEDVIREILALEEQQQKLFIREKAQKDFMVFVKYVYENFIEGTHHKKIATLFEKLSTTPGSRIIVNMPPRHTKSEFASYLLPAWLIGKNPKLKIIQTTHTAELAVRFGRKVRNLMELQIYKDIFPDVELRIDSKAAGRWETAQGGEYYAAGVGGAITGRGADLLIIDDPHSEQDALSESAMENAYEWYTSGPRQRLQPGGSIVVVMTRWSLKDLTGKLLKAQGSDVMSDQWDVVEFPAILPSDNVLWPEFWKKDELLRVKASLSLGKWNAQWQQNPVAEEGAIIKKEWWKKWEKKEIPPTSYIMQSYDTAFSKKETADYSAITTWGVFKPKEGEPEALILMDAQRGRWDFPELKAKALQEYNYWEPDMVIVEAKASGTPLTDELRATGIPVVNYTPSKGRDKHTRMHMVAPIFESGLVWAPERRFAEEVIDECAAFPHGDNDDFCDSMTMALIRYRKGGFVRLDSDEEDDDSSNISFSRQYY
jgi:predicted phage terminase large subunit-like protein|tara:strand:- start:18 stop:1478 length:1461 start_codon:yes stop_codon:yes gene_type:complete